MRIISVIAPCRDERPHIEAFCGSVLSQQLPEGWTLDLVIADGGSTDGTREWLGEHAARDPRVRVIDNPERIGSTGLNRALAVARGDVIARMDVHTTYAPDYLATCLSVLHETGADNVGGPWHARGEGARQEAIAAAFQSRWVTGGARARQIDYTGPAGSVYLGCWPRRTFDRYGLFDERLARNQDDEHNLRIVRGGGRVWQSAAIRSSYRPRSTLRALLRQYFEYGYWRPFVMRRHQVIVAPRHLAPGLLVLALVLSPVASLAGLPRPMAWAVPATYGAFVLGLSGMLAARTRPACLPYLPAAIVACQVGYGAGTLLGAIAAFLHPLPRTQQAPQGS